jgi:ribulose 1,5-bisphosphate synthetase/thiazole synthase
VLIPQVVFIATDVNLQNVTSESARLDKNVIRASGIVDATAHDDIMLCHVREKVLDRVTDIGNQYASLSAEQRAKIEQRIDAVADREKSRAHETWMLDQELLRQVNHWGFANRELTL